jgi:hypothetical protein
VSRAPAAPGRPARAAGPAAAPRGPRIGVARSAAAAAPLPAPAGAPPARPALTLVPSPPAPEPETGPSSIARSGVDELAEAGGGRVDYGDDGMATIDFAGGGAPGIPAFSTAPMTVTREIADAPATPDDSSGVLARAEASAPAASVAHSAAAPENDQAKKGPDADEIYEEVLQRLRRDLLAELEQQGHLLRDTF